MATFRYDKSLLNLKVIYKISSPTGKIYIGQTCNWAKRRRTYQIYRCEKQPKLYASLKKHGQESHLFEIIHTLPADTEPSIISQYEQLYMDLYRECGLIMLNVSPSANSMTGFRHTEETKLKMSESRKGKKLQANIKDPEYLSVTN